MCGGGYYSSWVSTTFSTIGACTAPTNLSSSSVTPSSATISWDAVTGAQYYIYGVRIIGATGWVYDTVFTNTVSLNNLNPSSQIRVRVQAECSSDNDNTSDFSSTYIFNTPACGLSITVTTTDATSGSSDGTASISVSGGFGSVTLNLNGADTTALSAGSYTVSATDAAGCIKTQTFIIEEEILCLDPANVTSNSISMTSATISWDAVSVTGKYDFRYREVGSSTWSTITNFLGTTYTLNGLSNGTDYEFEVRSMCGGGSYSSWVSTTFTTVGACTAPINLFANNITTVSAVIGWDAVPGALSYEYGVRIIGVTGWVYYTTNTNTLTLSGLSPGKQIRLRVRAICANDGSNTSPFSSTYIFNTPSSRLPDDVVSNSITELNIYPNPSLGIVNINFIANEKEDVYLNIRNSYGKTIYVDRKKQFIGTYSKVLDLEGYSKGVYYIQLFSNKKIINKQILIQ